MNIFVLHTDPCVAARMHCDKHVPKMCVEAAQMMASALRRRGATDEQMPLTKRGTPYKGGYAHHPCTVWAGDSYANWNWLWNHGMALCEEYEKRFGREHACYEPISFMGSTTVHWPHPHVLTPFALAMPDEFKQENAVQAYRAYYHSKTFAKWEKGRSAPHWWNG